jgi:hypothetical protein
MLATLQALHQDRRLRIGLVGDYNAGKSSLIKRICFTLGVPAPPDLEVGADPTTPESRAYPIGEMVFLDTPGLQSGCDAHDARALDALAGCSILVILFLPSLLAGTTTGLERLLRGDPAQGIFPMLPRTLGVITHTDTLAVDPREEPEGYARLCQSKRTELRMALRSRGIPAPPEQILSLAIDPDGAVGNRADVSADDYAASAGWDGFATFSAALDEARARWSDTAGDRAILERGVYLLARLRKIAEAELGEVERRIEALGRVQALVEKIQRAGTALAASLTAEAKHILESHLAPLLDEMQAATTPEAITATRKRLLSWPRDAALNAELLEWNARGQRRVDVWFQRACRELDRRFRAAERPPAWQKPSGKVVLPKKPLLKDPFAAASGIARGGSRLMHGTEPGTVQKLGRAAGRRIPKKRAEKHARQLRNASVFLKGLAVAADTLSLWMGGWMEKQREEYRAQVVKACRKTCREMLQHLTAPGPDGTGALASLAARQKKLAGWLAPLAEDLSTLVQKRSRLTQTIAQYERLMEQALNHLHVAPPRSEESA